MLRLRQPGLVKVDAIFDPHGPLMEDKEVRPAEIADFNQYHDMRYGFRQRGKCAHDNVERQDAHEVDYNHPMTALARRKQNPRRRL